MVKKAKNPRHGSSLADFLVEQGTYDETQAVALKRVIAYQIAAAMETEGVTKAEMARRMNTSRSQLDRLLDPKNETTRLDTIVKAAHMVGRSVRLELV